MRTEDWECQNTVALLHWMSLGVALVPHLQSPAGPRAQSLFVWLYCVPAAGLGGLGSAVRGGI